MDTTNHDTGADMTTTEFTRKFTDQDYRASWQSGYEAATNLCAERDLTDHDLMITAECLDREANRALDDGAWPTVAYNRGQSAYLYRLYHSRQEVA